MMPTRIVRRTPTAGAGAGLLLVAGMTA
jgi:hypothetical protein